MIRYFNWATKHRNKVPKFSSQTVLPESRGSLAFSDLVKMYDLRMYHISTYTSSSKGAKYVLDLEFLHNELNYRANNDHFFRFCIVFGGLLLFCLLFTDEQGERKNFNYKWPLVHHWNVFAELDEGGEEGDEPENL